ncbi:MAG: hypothetical protein Q9212_004540 [Teloschistes hypoglaucus]
MTVPKSSELQPGAKVNIILKADQSTGKRTTGHIADILTKNNNHPHGIKVRLTDGQIGRVQSMSATDPSTINPNHNAHTGTQYNPRPSHGEIGLLQTRTRSHFPSLEPEQRLATPSTSNAAATRALPHQLRNPKTTPSAARMVQDFRQDGYDPDSRQQSTSLLNYLRPPKQHKAAASAERPKPLDQTSPQVILEAEFPNLDSALVAAILADYSTIGDARKVLRGLS